MGCDVGRLKKKILALKFLLTHPVWDVTGKKSLIETIYKISTHTSRVGCDGDTPTPYEPFTNFYSHIPCGMWQFLILWWWLISIFLLTHPVWDVTSVKTIKPMIKPFLLTHPVWDVTEQTQLEIKDGKDFYSHIPCGMWQKPKNRQKQNDISFLLTHPVWDVTCFLCVNNGIKYISTHTSRVGCDRYI